MHLIPKAVSGTTTPGQSRPWSNGNEGVLDTPQISRTGASSSDAVYCQTQHSSAYYPIDVTFSESTWE